MINPVLGCGRERRRPAILSILTLCGLMLCRVVAAQGYGQWVMTRAVTGQVSYSYTMNGYTGGNTTSINANTYPGGGVSGPLTAASGSMTVTYTDTFEWVDQNGDPAPNPPSVVYLKQSAYAGGSASGNSSRSAYATNGMGSTPTTVTGNNPPSVSVMSDGARLIQRDGTSGVFTVTNTLTAGGTAAANPPGCGVSWGWSYSLVLDTRGVQIGSDMDPTYHEGSNHSRVLNVRATDGSLVGDTVEVPFWEGSDTENITYTGFPAGTWANGSSYHWYSGLTGKIEHGTWDGVNLPAFGVEYKVGQLFAQNHGNPGDQEYIHLRITDAADGLSAENVYVLNFHALTNDWTRTGTNVLPVPEEPTLDNYYQGEWHLLTSYFNPTQNVQPQTFSYQAQESVTSSGTLGSAQTFEASVEGMKIALSRNESVTVGQTYTLTGTQTTTVNCSSGVHTDIFWGITVEERLGVTCLWGYQGFLGQVPWSAQVPTTAPDGHLVIKWGVDERP